MNYFAFVFIILTSLISKQVFILLGQGVHWF